MQVLRHLTKINSEWKQEQLSNLNSIRQYQEVHNFTQKSLLLDFSSTIWMKWEETITCYSGFSLHFFSPDFKHKVFLFAFNLPFVIVGGFFMLLSFLFWLLFPMWANLPVSLMNILIDFRPFLQFMLTKLYFIFILPWICYPFLLCVFWKYDLHSFVFPPSFFHSWINSNIYSTWDALKWRKIENEMQTHWDCICQQNIKWESQKTGLISQAFSWTTGWNLLGV